MNIKNLKSDLTAVLVLAVLTVILILALNISANAAVLSGSCGDDVTYSLDSSSGVLTISGTGEMTNYTSSSAPWYSKRTLIKQVTVGSGITSIGNYAFYNCVNLTHATLSSTVISYGNYAFRNCSSLTSITTTGVATTGVITGSTVGIPIYSNVTNLGVGVFYGCTGITGMTIYAEVDTIGNYAFYKCSGLKIIQLPSTAESIGNYAFYDCSALHSVSISRTSSTSLVLNTSSNITSVGNYAFYGCSKLYFISILSKVTSIGSYAFAECSKLEYFTFPDNLTSIKTAVFKNCTALKRVTINNSLTQIYSKAFYNCAMLATVYYKGTKAEWEEISITSTGNTSLENADIVYLYEDDEDTAVEITAADVLGGIEITLSAGDSTQMIYYTTDGTLPTTRSKVYENSFTLTDAGTYTVEAISYDGEAYSEATEKTFVLEQTAKPVINCENSNVTITAEDGANIYCNYSLTPPTTSSNVYNEAFTVSTSTYVTAVAIKSGYAKSSSTSLYCVGTEEKEDFQPLADSYSFTNTSKSLFGKTFSYRSINTYISVFGETLGTALYRNNEYYDSGSLKRWGGACFGMALTSALFYTNGLTVDEYSSSDYGSIYDIPAPKSADTALTKLIERCQVSQYLPAFQTKMTSDALIKGDLSEIVSAVQSCGSEPIIIYMCAMNDGTISSEHAVLPYRVENSSDNSDIWYIYVYDSDIPNIDNGD
ncbi:MAG: leucine-rich repeat protein [Eubacterium sp.]|nr:leucine-rich repeat protein [Eubacterium sp.]